MMSHCCLSLCQALQPDTHTHTHEGEGERERGAHIQSHMYCYIFHYVNARFTPFFFAVVASCCPALDALPLPFPLPLLIPPVLYLFFFRHCSSSCLPRSLSSVAWDLRALYKKYCSIYKYTSIHYTHTHTYTLLGMCVCKFFVFCNYLQFQRVLSRF